nr:HU family DNA-binding protein [Parabacteroides goldsteinii]
MNKTDLIKYVAIHTGNTECCCRRMVDAVLDAMAEGLSDGEGITLQGFGSFRPWAQSQRLGRNPRTGEDCLITSRMSVKFRAGKDLLKVMNKQKE